jgi:TP901 family phage tail tape measure protein
MSAMVELEKLVIRLVGDASHFFETLREAEKRAASMGETKGGTTKAEKQQKRESDRINRYKLDLGINTAKLTTSEAEKQERRNFDYQLRLRGNSGKLQEQEQVRMFNYQQQLRKNSGKLQEQTEKKSGAAAQKQAQQRLDVMNNSAKVASKQAQDEERKKELAFGKRQVLIANSGRLQETAEKKAADKKKKENDAMLKRHNAQLKAVEQKNQREFAQRQTLQVNSRKLEETAEQKKQRNQERLFNHRQMMQINSTRLDEQATAKAQRLSAQLARQKKAEQDKLERERKRAQQQQENRERAHGRDKFNFDRQAFQQGQGIADQIASVTLGFASAGIKAFSDFNLAMTESTSLMGKIPVEQVEAMAQKALDLSSNSKYRPDELAKSYYYLASAGLNAEQSMQMIEPIMKFAIAGAFDLEEATSLAANAQAALGLREENSIKNRQQLVRITDVLVRANTLADGSTKQFSEALTTDAAATARSYGVSLESTVATLAAYAQQGIKGKLAGGHFGRMLRFTANNAVKHAGAFKRMGIGVFDASGNMRDMDKIIGDLETKMSTLSDKGKIRMLGQLGFQALTQRAILPLIGTSAKIREFKQELENAGGKTKEVADDQMKAFANQMMMVKNQVTVAYIEIGRHLAPVMLMLGTVLTQLMNAWKSVDPAVKSAVITFIVASGVVATVVSGMLAATFVIATLSAAFTPLLAVLAALGLAAAATMAILVFDAGGIQQFVDKAKVWLQSLADFFTPIGMALYHAFRVGFDLVLQIVQDLGRYLVGVWNKWVGSSTASSQQWQDMIVQGIVAVEYTMLNLGKVSELVWAKMSIMALETSGTILDVVESSRRALSMLAGAVNPFLRMAVDANLDGLKDLKKGMEPLLDKAREEFEKLNKDVGADFDKFLAKRKKGFAGIKLPVEEWVDALMKVGDKIKGVGEDGSDTFKKMAEPFNAALFRSAEGIARIQRYQDQLRRDTGRTRTNPMPAARKDILNPKDPREKEKEGMKAKEAEEKRAAKKNEDRDKKLEELAKKQLEALLVIAKNAGKAIRIAGFS